MSPIDAKRSNDTISEVVEYSIGGTLKVSVSISAGCVPTLRLLFISASGRHQPVIWSRAPVDKEREGDIKKEA